MERKNNLVRLRERRGLTQKEVAGELGVTRQAISQWEAGRTFPSMEKQLALSRLYGIPLEALYRDVPAWEKEVETEALPEVRSEPEQENIPKRRRVNKKLILAASLIGAYLLIYIWGVTTNSRAIATANMLFLTAIVLVASLLYTGYRIISYLSKNRKD